MEQVLEAVQRNDIDSFESLTEALKKRIQFPEQLGVVHLNARDLEDNYSLDDLLRMLISTSELVGETTLSREASSIAHSNQEKLLQTIKGRYNDLETKLQQVNEISGRGCDTVDGYAGQPDNSGSGVGS